MYWASSLNYLLLTDLMTDVLTWRSVSARLAITDVPAQYSTPYFAYSPLVLGHSVLTCHTILPVVHGHSCHFNYGAKVNSPSGVDLEGGVSAVHSRVLSEAQVNGATCSIAIQGAALCSHECATSTKFGDARHAKHATDYCNE